MLVISFLFKAETMFKYNREEFISGMQNIGVDSIESLKAKIPTLRAMLNDTETFRDIYIFTFKWACPVGQKSLPIDTAVALWRLLYSTESFLLLEEWLEYIETERKHAISRDEWCLLHNFVRTMDKNLTGYDPENSAWSVVIDTFVEHLNRKRGRHV